MLKNISIYYINNNHFYNQNKDQQGPTGIGFFLIYLYAERLNSCWT